MSLIPTMFNNDPWLSQPSTSDWGNYCPAFNPRRIYSLMDRFSRMNVGSRISSDIQPSIIGKDGFQACIDVKQFKPNEITVKTIENTVVVEGKHEEREDEHGYISRQFIRKYTLPEGYDTKDIVSTLSSDGILTIKAQRPATDNPAERIVQIQQTGPAHLNVTENLKEDSLEEKK